MSKIRWRLSAGLLSLATALILTAPTAIPAASHELAEIWPNGSAVLAEIWPNGSFYIADVIWPNGAVVGATTWGGDGGA